MHPNLFTTIRTLKLIEGCKATALNPPPPPPPPSTAGRAGEKLFHHLQDHLRVNSFRSKSTRTHPPPNQKAVVVSEDSLLPYGLPNTDLLEPQIDPSLKFVDLIDKLAEVYRRIENCSQFEKADAYLEQCAIFRGLSDPKLFRRSLRSARQHAVNVHTKVVLASWLRYERREDELIGTTSMDCCGRNLECPKASLVSGYDPERVYDPCLCSGYSGDVDVQECSTSEVDYDMSFRIGDDEVRCVRRKFASLSIPFKAMLYGDFRETRLSTISFTQNGISVEGMRAAEVFSRVRKVEMFPPNVVLELLTLANMFCCDELKAACDMYLARSVNNLDDAVLLIEYALEEDAYLLVAACLQIFLRELPSSLHNPNVVKILCSVEGRERLAFAGHASFTLYLFLSQIAMEDDMKSNTTVMVLECLVECAVETWQKQLACHQLGVVMLERQEYKDAQRWFNSAAKAGHVYSLVGVARSKFKRGHRYSAYKIMNSLISGCSSATGWMHQERSLYRSGEENMVDIDIATDLDPTLTFPYKFRAASLVEESQFGAAVAELNKILRFKVSPDCLEMRAWISIAMKNYEGALKDIRALVTLEPNFLMFNKKIHGDHMVELLRPLVQRRNQADCWMQLYDRWLNCQKAAMRSLRLARNHSKSEHERLVYEGWILYDTGHREEALAKAEESVSIQRSFEAYFLKAYALADSTLDPESSKYVIQLLEEALRCPSDGLRKGQALNNLGSVYVDCEKLDLAADCYKNALTIKHTRAHQGLARVYHLKSLRKDAYNEMTKLIEKAQNNASAFEKRSEYCDREMAQRDLVMATQLDPLRTYPYRYRAAVLMDDHKETEAIEELSKAIAFKPDLQLLHLRAAFFASMRETTDAIRDCEAALSLDPCHKDTINLLSQST
ncbi:hypothetical protein Bca101_017748 [Brassica carinata]